jgi:predicted DNA repair protein MutK
VAVLATIGVYGVVAFIVRMDDIGFKLIESAGEDKTLLKRLGELMVMALPKVIKSLSVIGTIAMLLVAGGIFMHNIPQIHDAFHHFPSILAELFIGLVVGAAALMIEKSFIWIKSRA